PEQAAEGRRDAGGARQCPTPGGAQTDGAVVGERRSVTPLIEADAQPAFHLVDERFRFAAAHVGEVVDVLLAERAEADAVTALHRVPRRAAGRGDADLVER